MSVLLKMRLMILYASCQQRGEPYRHVHHERISRFCNTHIEQPLFDDS